MNRVKKYIKVFTTVSLLTGALFGLSVALKVGSLNGMLAGVVLGISWGVLIILVLMFFDFFTTKNIPPESLNIYRSCEVQIESDYEQVFQTCLDILKGLKFIKAITPSKENMLISVRTRLSWASFGEEMTLQFAPTSQGMIKVCIASFPVVRYTMFDYGKNFRNVDSISRMVSHVYQKQKS